MELPRGSKTTRRVSNCLPPCTKTASFVAVGTTVKYLTDLPMGTWYRPLHCKEHDPVGGNVSTIERAIAIAAEAHAGQKDWGG